MTGSGLEILNSANKQAFVGRSFQLNNAPVKTKVSNYAFWISSPDTPAMLVVVTNPTQPNPSITQGDEVNVTGTVRKAPPEEKPNRIGGSAATERIN